MRQIWSLQYLRAVAAVGVVVFHVLEGTRHRFALGAAGVDIFFVLSGFLMFLLTSRRPMSPRRFLLDRVARIVPLYWIATLTIFAAAWASRDGIYLVRRSPTLLVQSLFFLPRGPLIAGNAVYPTLFVGWTLDDEMFFYILFAGALLLTASPERRVALMSAVFGSLVAIGVLFHPRDSTLASETDPIILEFLAGAWIAALLDRHDRATGSIRLPALGFAAILVLSLVLHAFPRSLFAFIAVSLVAGAVVGERARLVPKIAAIRFLGDASYSIYLFQILAFHAADSALFHAGAAFGFPLGSAVRVPVEIGAALLLGSTVHVAVERPLLEATRRILALFTREPARTADGLRSAPGQAEAGLAGGHAFEPERPKHLVPLRADRIAIRSE